MTKYESAKIFVDTYTRWQSLWKWRDLFHIGIHCETTDLLKTPRPEILERSQLVLGPEMGKKYVAAVAAIDGFNADFRQVLREARKEMDRTHVQMLETCFPKNRAGHYTVHDRCTGMTIAFSMGDHFVSATISRAEDKEIFGYFDFKSPDIGATHCRFNLAQSGDLRFTTEDDCY